MKGRISWSNGDDEALPQLLPLVYAELRNRTHFIDVALRLIRQILVDYARARHAAKRDGGERVPVEVLDGLPVTGDGELLALDDALNDL